MSIYFIKYISVDEYASKEKKKIMSESLMEKKN